MTERIDHVGWAREFVRAAENAFDGEVTTTPRDEPTVSENIALAQVHATLALVEQQRIANLIALSTPQEFGPDGATVSRPVWDMDGLMHEDIREGLGL